MARARALARAAPLRGGNSLQTLRCGLRLRACRAQAARPAPTRLGGALQVALAEREHDALVEQRLGVLRVERQANSRTASARRPCAPSSSSSRPRSVLASGFFGSSFDALFVPLDRIGIALGVEVGVAELHVRAGVPRIALDDRLQALHLAFVERRRLVRAPGAAPPAGAGAGVAADCCSCCTAVAPRLGACCVPITQPRMMPKHMPAMAKTMESDLMEMPGPRVWHRSTRGTRPTSLPSPGQRGLEPVHQRADDVRVAGEQRGAVRNGFRKRASRACPAGPSQAPARSGPHAGRGCSR